MHHPRGSAFSLFMALVGACGGPPAPTARAPAAPAAPLRPAGEPIAEYVVAAFADSKGVLWFGTLGKGVARYDGASLTYLSPAGSEGGDVVVSIAEDSEGDLWFAGHDGTGLVRYDGATFTQIWEEESSVGADRRGRVWAGTRRALFRREGDRFSEVALPLGEEARAFTISPGRVALQLEDGRGDLWFRSDGYGVFRYDGKTFTRFSKRDGLCSDTVFDIAEDRQGRVWFACVQAFQPVATGDGGVVRYDGSTFTGFPAVKGLAGTDIYTLFVDRAGDVWIGATGLGVYRYDGEVFTLISETDRPDLNGGFGLQALAEDRRGALWFGFSGGLFRIEGERFVHVTRTGPWQ